MTNKIPDGAITDIKSIKPGMMVKVKDDPVLHECLSNDVYSEDGVDEWGMLLRHEPRMEYYNAHGHGYGTYSSCATSDYAHMYCIEYALPPIPSGYLAIARSDGNIALVEVGD